MLRLMLFGLLLIGGVIAGANLPLASWLTAGEPHWQEIAWPFPRDAWPPGRAFRCTSEGCGLGVEVYVRPKIGFCNCATGVAGDAEVDAVSDLDMIAENFTPERPGERVDIAGMAGRSRAYALKLADGTTLPAVGTAISRKCDVVVAASQGRDVTTKRAQDAIATLVASPDVLGWLNGLLGKG
eukprot:gene8851-8942_t